MAYKDSEEAQACLWREHTIVFPVMKSNTVKKILDENMWRLLGVHRKLEKQIIAQSESKWLSIQKKDAKLLTNDKLNAVLDELEETMKKFTAERVTNND